MPHLIDIHCHLLPYVDDGARDIHEAVEALQRNKDQGIDRIILTPHYRRGMFETPQEEMQDEYDHLKTYAEEIGVKIYTGCEYHADEEMVQNLTSKSTPVNSRRWTLANSPYVLTEFSSRHTYAQVYKRVVDLRMHNLRPIIAHIERYPAVRGENLSEETGRNDNNKLIDLVEDLIDAGAYIQVNADAILGYDGRLLQKYTKFLLDNELVHFIASDAHGVDYRPSHLAECYTYLSRKYGSETADRLCTENPKKVIRAGLKVHSER